MQSGVPIWRGQYLVAYIFRWRNSTITGITIWALPAALPRYPCSGKALNIDLFEAGSFTVSLNSLRSVMYGKERNAMIVKIPAPSSIRLHRVEEGQQKISAAV